MLKLCVIIAGRIEDYSRRKNIIIITGKDIVKVLKALIISGENRDSRQNVISGLTLEQVITIIISITILINLISHA